MIKRLRSTGKTTVKILAFASLSLFSSAGSAQDAKKGEELFKAKCTACHAIKTKQVGPALTGVYNRRSEKWLVSWIRNNQKLRESGDKDAVAIYNEYGKAPMNVFEDLTEADVKSIIAYVKAEDTKKPAGPVVKEPEAPKAQPTTLYILMGLVLILVTLFLILRKVKSTLDKMVAEKFPEEAAPAKSWKEKYLPARLQRMNPTVLAMFTGTLVLLVGGTYGYIFGMREIGVQKGYAPEQPIKYSHAVHAGKLGIDCKYCHMGADKSKSATIPSLNTCMNCHKGVQLRDRYNDQISPEIKKIYAALDYDPEKPAGQQYGPNPRPVKWIRIHNLPDHAYFNHSQHVKVAGIACQKCHGPIQKMDVVQQQETLQMGWCINCHRQTNIDVENNDYYEKLHKFAKEDKTGKYLGPDGKIVITAAMNGGLECSKCHY